MNQQELNQYWKNHQFERINKTKSNDEKWLNENLTPEMKKLLTEIMLLVDAYSIKFTENGKISITQARKNSSKEDLESFNELVDNLEMNPLNIDEDVLEDESNLLKKESKLQVNNLNLLMDLITLKILEFSNKSQTMIYEKLDDDMEKELNVLKTHPNIINISTSKQNKIKNQYQNMVNYGATYSDRIWREYKKMSRNISNLVESSIFNDKPTEQWSKKLKNDIKDSLGKSLRQIKEIVVSEVGTVLLLSGFELIKESKIAKVQVVCEATACPTCSPNDGTILSVDEVEFGGNAPKWHPNCRCLLIPYIE